MRCPRLFDFADLISKMARFGIARVGPGGWNNALFRRRRVRETRNRRFHVRAGFADRFRFVYAGTRTRHCPCQCTARFRAARPATPTHSPARRRSNCRIAYKQMIIRRRTRDFRRRGAFWGSNVAMSRGERVPAGSKYSDRMIRMRRGDEQRHRRARNTLSVPENCGTSALACAAKFGTTGGGCPTLLFAARDITHPASSWRGTENSGTEIASGDDCVDCVWNGPHSGIGSGFARTASDKPFSDLKKLFHRLEMGLTKFCALLICPRVLRKNRSRRHVSL